MALFRRIWHDEAGFIATTDLLLLTTIVVLGMIVGLVMFRNQVVQEFVDMAMAIGHLNHDYTYDGTNDSQGGPDGRPDGEPDVPDECFVAGSYYIDETDFCQAEDEAGEEPGGISVRVPPLDEGGP